MRAALQASRDSLRLDRVSCERLPPVVRVDARRANIVPQHPADRAAWIWGPDWRPDAAQVLRFSRELVCASDTDCVVHLSADQRYQFYIDGELVARGPDNSDLAHWSVAAYRLRLPAGPHRLAVLVWWLPDGDDAFLGPRAPMAHMTWRGGFLLAAEGEWDARLSTGRARWQVEDFSGAVTLSRPTLLGYHDIGPAYSFEMAAWGRPRSVEAAVVRKAVGKGSQTGLRLNGWRLSPTPLPEQKLGRWSGGRIRAVRDGWGEGPWDERDSDPAREALGVLPGGGGPVTIGPDRTMECIWDTETYLCGYPDLIVSGGRDGELRLEWAEALFLPGTAAPTADPEHTSMHKDRRDQVSGRVWLGFGDRWQLDGPRAELPALWWRSGRYLRLRIATKSEPLTIHRFGIRETGYPLEIDARFACDDPALEAVLPLMERTLRMNAHEAWTDCPYYEQLAYLGDNATGLAPYVLCRDGRLDRRGIALFDWSRDNDNLVAERYPSRHRQESGTYAMLYPLLLDDYLRWRSDDAFAAERLPGLRGLVEQILTWRRPDGNLGPVPGWPFVDWCLRWDCGCGPGLREGDASLLNLHLLLALERAASIEDAYGEAAFAGRLRSIGEEVKQATRARFWNARRSLMADDPERRHYCEHAQALAILTGVLEGEEAEACFEAWMAARGELVPASIYFSHYLLEVFYRLNRPDAFFAMLDFWKALPAQGFVTLPEAPEPARSDCHAWGAHPLYHCYASIAGIRPGEHGFRKVRIAPMPGPLRRIELSMPHPLGTLGMRLDREQGRCEIALPEGLDGSFEFEGKTGLLRPGANRFDL